MESKDKKRVFSGIQPSGNIHIGNYLGAIKQFTKLQYTHDAIFCIVDEHAITVTQTPEALYENTLNTALLYLACGIDAKEAVIFVQSHVPAHTELAWLLNTITPVGELLRMTQYKEKSPLVRKTAGKKGILSPDGGSLLSPLKKEDLGFAGILNYPTLMAADILLYKTTHVPVGEDQKQHIELTRSITERFNNKYGEIFVIPEAMIREDTARIMSLDDPHAKMSKSSPSTKSYINLLDTPDDIRRKIKNAVTDSGSDISYDRKKRPAISNLMAIFRGVSGMTFKEIEERYNEKGYAEFKDALAEAIIHELTPIQERFRELSANKGEAERVLREGARRARSTADATLQDVKTKMGFFI